MKSKFNKVALCASLKFYILVIALNVLFFPTFTKYETPGYNRFAISVNGVFVGYTDDEARVYDYYREARKALATASENIVFTEFPDISVQGECIIVGEVDDDELIIDNMKNIISANMVGTMSHAYSLKVEDEIVYVDSAEDAADILQQAVDKFDVHNEFDVVLGNDRTRELNVLYATIEKNENIVEEATQEYVGYAGFEAETTFNEEELLSASGEGFDAYDYGIESMTLSKTVEIVEAYVPSEMVMATDEAAALLVNEQEVQQIYKVEPGDTLSEISIKLDIPLDDLIALNDALDNEYTIINIDQELVITVPEPALTVEWTEVAKLEEPYNLPVEYVYNDSWYTSTSVTLQQPSAGYHEAVLEIHHDGSNVVDQNTLYEVVMSEPVPKIVEVGTIIPPTFIKPLSGGRISSYFGGRRSPTSGASSNHEGLDYYTPLGSSVYAACTGTVTRAGWSGGYGYCVDIQHSNGAMTRYAHLSRVYVSVGQYVTQGQVIAASGSTGISTGPHLHFEIRFNGVAVNPLNYL